MAIKLIGVDGSTRSSQVNVNAATRINAADFRGQAYQVQQQLLDTQFNELQSIIQNEASTRKSISMSQSSGGSSGGGSSRGADPGDVSEREKFEYTKYKDAKNDGLAEAKFKEDVLRDRRDYNYKVEGEQKKSAAEMQYAMATQEIEELQDKTRISMNSGGGMAELRSGLNSILKKYPYLTGDQQRELISKGYVPAHETTKNYIEETKKKTESIQGYQRSTALSEQRLALQGVMTNLNTATGSERQRLLGTVEQRLAALSSNPNVDPQERAFVISGIMEDVVKNGQGGSELVNTIGKYDSYNKDMAELYGRRSAISPAQYDYEASRLALKYGIKSSDTSALKDPNFNEKKVQEKLQVIREVEELRKKNQLDGQMGLATSRGAIGSLAKQYATPADIESLKAYSQRYGNPPGLAAAIKVAEGLVEYRQFKQDTTSKVNAIDKEIAMLNAGTASSVLQMLGRGGEDITSMLIFKSLSPDIQAAFQGGKGLTPEQKEAFVSQFTAQRQRAAELANQEKQNLAVQDATKRQYLEIYVGKEQFAAYDAYKVNKAQTPQMKQQVGVAPQRTNTVQPPSQFLQQAQQALGGK